MSTTVEQHHTQRAHLLGLLRDNGWTHAIRALHFAEEYHCGLRKDGTTPEFSHQVHICLFLAPMAPSLRDAEQVMATALLHDVCEDYDVTFTEIGAAFGLGTRRAVAALTKDYRGERLPEGYVAAAQARNEVASVVKGADRVHNQATALGVFSGAKIAQYTAETRAAILPMLSVAHHNFPGQGRVYRNTARAITAQLSVLESVGGQGEH